MATGVGKTFKCPFCPKAYGEKPDLYHHMESEHAPQLGSMSPAQAYFNHRYGKVGGRCVICRRPTEFNEKAERYERFDTEHCRQVYRQQFVERMRGKYGKDHLLDDPERQKLMLQSRGISGTYTWSDGKHRTSYTGSYERDFLEFLDVVLGWTNPDDVMMPAPQVFRYIDKEGKERFYIPDCYIGSLNLIVEVKGSAEDNHHPYRLREWEKEKIKDDILGQSDYDFVKIVDKDYSVFFNYLLDLKDGAPKPVRPVPLASGGRQAAVSESILAEVFGSESEILLG